MLKISAIILFLSALFLLNLQRPTRDSLIQSCHNQPDNIKKSCWERIAKEAVSYGGPSEAFLLVSDLYKNEKDFGKSCHNIVHKIGEETYTQFSKDKMLEIPKDASLCDFGFYHGFMEYLVGKGDSLSKARDFCDDLEKQSLAKKIPPNSMWSCYHGIGHGTFDVHNESVWGNLKAMLNPSLELCEKVAYTPRKLEICYTGSFNALQIAFVTHSYKLSLDNTNPFSVCESYNDPVKQACYPEMAFAYIINSQLNFNEGAKFIEGIKKESYRQEAIYDLSSQVLGRNAVSKNDFSSEIGECNKLSANLRAACIKGIAYGLMAFAQPSNLKTKIAKLCNSNLLDSTGKNSCYEQISDFIYSANSYDAAGTICRSIKGNMKGLACR